MTRIIIAIGLLAALLATVAAKQDIGHDEVLKLGYNPTYDLWFFLPNGRPDKVTDPVKDAYEERRPGGVCFRAPDNWFYCATKEVINAE